MFVEWHWRQETFDCGKGKDGSMESRQWCQREKWEGEMRGEWENERKREKKKEKKKERETKIEEENEKWECLGYRKVRENEERRGGGLELW